MTTTTDNENLKAPEAPVEAPEVATAQEPVTEWNTEEAAEEAAEATEGEETSKAKKLISLRLPLEDLGRAKALAEELRMGYQTLLCQIINEGLKQQEAQLRLKNLTESIKGSMPALKTAEELASSPAVKAAQDLLNSPAVKAAQELVSSPVVKAAEELKGNPQFKAAQERAQELANTPANWARELVASPTVQTVQALANGANAKVIQEFAGSPAFKSAEALVASVKAQAEAGQSSEELQKLNQAVADIQNALRKAGLMA
ncbi:MAG: hypothetical protein ACLGIN_10040 [Candidatus Sericytochromatia bacterium]